jgi:hypothetical protein
VVIVMRKVIQTHARIPISALIRRDAEGGLALSCDRVRGESTSDADEALSMFALLLSDLILAAFR